MMQDREISTLFLTLEKEIMKGYATAITEASNSSLEKHIQQLFDMNLRAHRDLFDLMVTNGWYKIEQVNDDQKEKEYNKLNSLLQGMNE